MPGIIVTPETFLPVCTDEDVKDYLKISDLDTEESRFLVRMIAAATNWMEGVLNRKLKSRAYSGSCDGNGDTVLYPTDDEGHPLCPITTLTSVVIDDITMDVADVDEVLLYGSAGFIRLVNGWTFTKGFQNIDLELAAGFTDLPQDVPILVQACCELVAQKWRRRDKQNQDWESISEMGATITFRKDDMHKETYNEMIRYRKAVFA